MVSDVHHYAFKAGPLRPLVFGHRGVREPDLAENTMPAFERAVRAGADGVELDVRLSKDGHVVVLHDDTLKRTTDNNDPRRARALTKAELATVRQRGDAAVPSLEEALDYLFSAGLRVNVELKYDDVDRLQLVRAVRRVFKRVNRPPIILSSFDPRIVAWCRLLLPTFCVGFLFEPDNRYLPWNAGALLGHALHPHHSVVTSYAVRFAADHQKLINVWTVNEPDEMRRLQALSVDAIITDKPALARRVLG